MLEISGRHLLLSLFAGFALVLVALVPPAIYGSDSANMMGVADSLATDGNFDVPCGDQALPGRGGRCFSTFYPLISILAVPFVLAGRAISSFVGVSPEFGGHLVALLVPALAAAGAATMTAAVAWQFGASKGAGIFAGAAFAFGTEVLTYARTFFAETLAAFFVILALWGLTQTGRKRWWWYAGIPLAILTKPQMVLIGPAIGLVLAVGTRKLRPLWEAGFATAAGAVIYGLYNWLRFEDATNFGGASREIGAEQYAPGSVVDALGLLLISPGRGLIWFSPIVLVGAYVLFQRRREPLALACVAACAAILLVAVSNPGSGWNWGTRYLVPALPLLCAAAGAARGRALRAAVALALVGFIVALPTTFSPFQRYYAENAERGQIASQRYWNLADGPLIGVWGSAARQLQAAADTDVAILVEQNEAGREPELARVPVEEQPRMRIVALWWWVLPAGGVPWYVGALASALCILAGASTLVLSARRPLVHRRAAQEP
jgi:hypothetical protein